MSHKLDSYDFASKLGCSQSTVTAYESHSRPIPDQALKSYFNILNNKEKMNIEKDVLSNRLDNQAFLIEIINKHLSFFTKIAFKVLLDLYRKTTYEDVKKLEADYENTVANGTLWSEYISSTNPFDDIKKAWLFILFVFLRPQRGSGWIKPLWWRIDNTKIECWPLSDFLKKVDKIYEPDSTVEIYSSHLYDLTFLFCESVNIINSGSIKKEFAHLEVSLFNKQIITKKTVSDFLLEY
jgi:transcriptional regulator with XRE-family HTH domain